MRNALVRGGVSHDFSTPMAPQGKSAIYHVGRMLNDKEMYIITIYDLDPAGLQVRAYQQAKSMEFIMTPSEAELEKAGITRLEAHLEKLANSVDLVERGGKTFLESSLPGVLKQKVVPQGEGVRQFIGATAAGSETLPELLTTALSELCKEKPAGLEACRWLGQWLLDHNPNQPAVEEPES